MISPTIDEIQAQSVMPLLTYMLAAQRMTPSIGIIEYKQPETARNLPTIPLGSLLDF